MTWYKLVMQHFLVLYYRKIHYLTREFHVKFHAKSRYRTNREAMSAISVFLVKFHVEFTSQVMDFPWIAEPFKNENVVNVANFSAASLSSRNTALNILASLANQSARIIWAMRFYRISHPSHVFSWYTHSPKEFCVYRENTNDSWDIPYY